MKELTHGNFDMQFSEATETAWYNFYKDYLDIEPENGKSKYTINCLNTENHKAGDKHKSAFIDLSTGVYGCSVCGSFAPWRFLAEIIGLDPVEAKTITSQVKQELYSGKDAPLRHLDFTRPPTMPMYQYNTEIEHAHRLLNPSLDIVKDYMESRDLEYETLVDWQVGYLPEQDCLILPYKRNGHVVAVRGRNLSGQKGSIKDSSFIPYGLDRLVSAEYALIVEGETDTLAAYQALKKANLHNKIAVVGIPGANSFKKEWSRYFSHCRKIFHIPQTDKAAETLVNKIIQVLSNSRVEIIELPWGFFDQGKDVADFLHQHSYEEFVHLLPDLGDERPFVLTTDEVIEAAGIQLNYVIPGLISPRDKGIIYGKPKAFKTWLALNIAAAIAKGNPVLNNIEWKSEPHTVLFVEEEGNFVKFSQRVNMVMNGETTSNASWIHGHGVNLDDEFVMRKFEQVLEDMKPEVIFIDPFASIHNADENSNSDIAAAWRKLKTVVYRCVPEAVIILLHHIPKSATDKKLTLMDSRGASFTAGEVDFGIGIRRAYNEEVDDKVILYANIEGREIPDEQHEHRIVVDPCTFEMCLDGLNVEISSKESRQKRAKFIKNLLNDNPSGLTIDEIGMELDLSSSTVRSALAVMQKRKQVERKEGLPTGGTGRPPSVYVLLDTSNDN